MIFLTLIFVILFYLIIEYYKNVKLGIKLAKHFKEVPYIPLFGDYHLFPTNEGMAGKCEIFLLFLIFVQKDYKKLIWLWDPVLLHLVHAFYEAFEKIIILIPNLQSFE